VADSFFCTFYTHHPTKNTVAKKRNNAITVFSDTLAANVKTPSNLYDIYRSTLSGKK